MASSSSRNNKKKVQEFLKRQGKKFPEIKRMQEQYNMEQRHGNNNRQRPDHIALQVPTATQQQQQQLYMQQHKLLYEQEQRAAKIVNQVDQSLIQTQQQRYNDNNANDRKPKQNDKMSRGGNTIINNENNMEHIQSVKQQQMQSQVQRFDDQSQGQSMFGEDEVEDLIATFENENKKYRQDIVTLTQQRDRLEKDYNTLDERCKNEIEYKSQQLEQAMEDLRYLKEKNADAVGREIKLKADNKILRGTIKDLHDSIKRITMGARDAVEAATEQSASMALEIQSLKKNFVMAKQYKLHTALEHLSKESTREQQRLQRIIAHMQAEKIALQSLLQQAEDDRDASSMRLQLAKQENERILNEVNAYHENDGNNAQEQRHHQIDDNANDNTMMHLSSNNDMQLSVIPEDGYEDNYSENKINDGQKHEEHHGTYNENNNSNNNENLGMYVNASNNNNKKSNKNNAPVQIKQNKLRGTDTVAHKRQMQDMEQELLKSLSIDTAAPTFETVDLIDENGNTPSANLEAVLVAMQQSVMSVEVPPSPIMPLPNKNSNNQQQKQTESDNLNQQMISNKASFGVAKSSKNFVSSPLVSTGVIDPEDDNTYNGKAIVGVGDAQNNPSIKPVKKRNYWSKMKVAVALSKPSRKPPPVPP
jgi:hypothetical protein